MKRVAIIPVALVSLFFPVFALQAEKISTPLPAPKVLFSANSEIVLSDSRLRNTLITVRFPDDPQKKHELFGTCVTVSKAVWSEISPSGIRTEILPVSVSATCSASKIELFLRVSGKKTSTQAFFLPILREADLFADLSDLSDDALFLYARNANESSEFLAQKSAEMLSATGSNVSEKFSALTSSYRSANWAFRSKFAFNLHKNRAMLRYLVPVVGKSMPTEYPFIPGAGRPYRKSTTDAIHHGWDLMAPIGTPVQAIGDGVVIRTVEGFAWRDFERLQKGANLTEDQRRLNLDVYRGNQVWLKTADGNVTFYSHLRDLAPGISQGSLVKAGEILGTIGVSGVPDRSYDNPHLHFEIQKNPHNGGDSKSPLSIMRWDWLGKGLNKVEANGLVAKMFEMR